MLADAASNAAKDVARRNLVRQRVMAYNRQLEEACRAYGPDCRYDGGAVFSYPYTLKHVSAWDYFHPNSEGQKVLARITFDARFLSPTAPLAAG
jgi:hypothetical protein